MSVCATGLLHDHCRSTDRVEVSLDGLERFFLDRVRRNRSHVAANQHGKSSVIDRPEELGRPEITYRAPSGNLISSLTMSTEMSLIGVKKGTAATYFGREEDFRTFNQSCKGRS